MRLSKILKLSAVGLALLLIPRRSSKLSDIEAINKDQMNKEAPKDDPLETIKGNHNSANSDDNNDS